MNLEPTESQLQIAATATDYLRDQLPPARLLKNEAVQPAIAREELRALAELGWMGMTLPANVGGAEMSLPDEILLAREVGRALAPFGWLSTALAARIAFRAANHPLAAALTRGDRVAGLAAENVKAGRSAVLGAEPGDLVVVLGPARARMLELPSDATVQGSVDISVPLAWTSDASAAVVCSCETDAASTLWAEAMVLGGAVSCGIAEACLDLSLEHARARQQFGKPIGAFQAISHTCANLAVQCAAAWAQVRYAAVSLHEGHEHSTQEAAAAQLVTLPAAFATVQAAIQIHGAMGTTDEFILHRYLKRLHVMEAALGRKQASIAALM